MFFMDGRLYMVLSSVVFMMECRLWVLVLCVIVFLVIVFSVLLWNFRFMFFRLNSVWYCLVRVFFGFLRIWIRVFLFSLFNVVIIGRWLINLGIRLNLIRFFGLICVSSLFLFVLLDFVFIVVLKLMLELVFIWWEIILFRLVNVLL